MDITKVCTCFVSILGGPSESARSSASDVGASAVFKQRPYSRSSSKGTAHIIGQLGESLGSRPGSSAEYINSIDYFREPVVKSPAEPTRVRSPEAVVSACYSPDPINWTVPLDTGKTFSVTQSVKEGSSGRRNSSLNYLLILQRPRFFVIPTS